MRQFARYAASASIFAFIAATPFAQAQEPAEAESDAPGAREDVIVVTARRREESLLDVPGSVTVLGAEVLEEAMIDSTEELLRNIPGATLVNAGPDYANDASIRGQGGGRVGFSETATGIYRDGHYIAGGGFGGRSFSRLDLLDVARTEVLRGPQGALYGRNAVGGAINVVPNAPVFETEGEARLTYDDRERLVVSGVANIPVVDDRSALRVAAYRLDQDGGFITNINTGNTLDQQAQTGVRAAWKTLLSESADITFTYEFYDAEAPGFSNLGYRATRTDGVTLDPSVFERDVSREGFVDIEEHVFLVDATADLGFGTLAVKLNYEDRQGARTNEDLDHFIGFQNRAFGGVAVDLFAEQFEDFHRFGATAYIVSAPDAPFPWLLGAEHLSFESDVLTVNAGQSSPVGGLRALLRDDASVEDLSSFAIFGSADFDLTGRLTATVEGRVQVDEKAFTFDRTRNDANSLAQEILGVEAEEIWWSFLPAVALNYEASPNHTLYARASTGYRPGGFNSGIPADIPNADQFIPYDPEYAYGVEGGWKGALHGGRTNIAVGLYYIQTQDAQIITNPSETITAFILQNAGDTEVYGVEIEASTRMEVGPGVLMLTGGVASNDGEFREGTSVILSGGVTDLSGLRLNRTRDFVGSGTVMYTFPAGPGRLRLAGNVQAGYGGNEDALGIDQLGEFTIFGARATYLLEDVRFSVFAENINDEIYRLQDISSNGYYNQPRTIGVEIGVEF